MPEHKILIVEDEEAIAHVMESILSANHYIPLSVKNGGQALALASAERPDLVLLDLGLPDMDGVEGPVECGAGQRGQRGGPLADAPPSRLHLSRSQTAQMGISV